MKKEKQGLGHHNHPSIFHSFPLSLFPVALKVEGERVGERVNGSAWSVAVKVIHPPNHYLPSVLPSLIPLHLLPQDGVGEMVDQSAGRGKEDTLPPESPSHFHFLLPPSLPFQSPSSSTSRWKARELVRWPINRPGVLQSRSSIPPLVISLFQFSCLCFLLFLLFLSTSNGKRGSW